MLEIINYCVLCIICVYVGKCIISDDNRELFERKMRIASHVHHPNLVLFIAVETTGNPVIVSELMETSLRKVMEAEILKPPDISVPSAKMWLVHWSIPPLSHHTHARTHARTHAHTHTQTQTQTHKYVQSTQK